jgi:hypothetical protein
MPPNTKNGQNNIALGLPSREKTPVRAEEQDRRRLTALDEESVKAICDFNEWFGTFWKCFSEVDFTTIEKIFAKGSPCDDLRFALVKFVVEFDLDVRLKKGSGTRAEARRRVLDTAFHAKTIFQELSRLNEPTELAGDDLGIYWEMGGVLEENGVDLNSVLSALRLLILAGERLGAKKGTLGRPAEETWNSLLSAIIKLYEDKTGRPATVTDNRYKEKKYSGMFLGVAEIIVNAASKAAGVKPLTNGELGPRLQRLRLVSARSNAPGGEANAGTSLPRRKPPV